MHHGKTFSNFSINGKTSDQEISQNVCTKIRIRRYVDKLPPSVSCDRASLT